MQKPGLSLFDAVNLSLGSIIGAGIFVILGAAVLASGALYYHLVVKR